MNLKGLEPGATIRFNNQEVTVTAVDDHPETAKVKTKGPPQPKTVDAALDLAAKAHQNGLKDKATEALNRAIILANSSDRSLEVAQEAHAGGYLTVAQSALDKAITLAGNPDQLLQIARAAHDMRSSSANCDNQAKEALTRAIGSTDDLAALLHIGTTARAMGYNHEWAAAGNKFAVIGATRPRPSPRPSL